MGASFNLLMETETKESLAGLYIDALAEIRLEKSLKKNLLDSPTSYLLGIPLPRLCAILFAYQEAGHDVYSPMDLLMEFVKLMDENRELKQRLFEVSMQESIQKSNRDSYLKRGQEAYWIKDKEVVDLKAAIEIQKGTIAKLEAHLEEYKEKAWQYDDLTK